MKTIHYLLTVLLGLSVFSEVQAQDFVDYSEHSYWNDSYPIHDAVTYKGKFYALQNYSKGVRLVEFDVYPQHGTMNNNRYWTVAGSSDSEYYGDIDAEAVEYRGALYIFGKRRYDRCNQTGCYKEGGAFAHKFVLESNGDGSHADIPIPHFLKNIDSYYPNISATVYKNALCLFYVNKNDQKVRMAYTTGDPADPNVKWEIRETISQVIYGKTMTGQDTWDVCTWYGESNGAFSQKLVIGLVAGRNMWAYTFEGDLTNSNNSTWTSASYFDAAPDFGAFSLKLLQGAITGIGNIKNDTTTNNNPVQFIYAIQRKIVTGNIHQRQILTNEYFPSTNKMGNPATYGMSTNLPYGHFGASIVSFPYDNPVSDKEDGLTVSSQHHQQFICIFRGACDNHFSGDSHYALIKSNRAKVSKYEIEGIGMLKDPELRKCCTLVGVIEGAPPVIVDNQNMYNKLYADTHNNYVSALTIGKTITDGISDKSTNGYSIDGGLGPDLDMFTLQALGGYELQKSTENVKTITTQHSNTLFNKSVESARTGYYIYSIPNLVRYSYAFYNPDGTVKTKGRPTLYTYYQEGAADLPVNFALDSVIIGSNIRVEKPEQLESWQKRGAALFDDLLHTNSLIHQTINSTIQTDDKLEESASSSQASVENIEVGGTIKTPGFNMTGKYKFSINKSTTATVGKDISFDIKDIEKEKHQYFKRETDVTYYGLRAIFLSDDRNPATQAYHDDLIRRGAMLKGEKPFIIAWNIYGLPDEMKAGATPTSDETITPEGNRIYNEGDALMVKSAPGSQVQVYSIGGRMETNALSANGLLRVPLPAGMYIIRIQSGKEAKVYKAMKR